MKIAQPIIQYIGFKDLTNSEKRTVEKIATEYQEKIQRLTDKPTTVKIQFKVYEEEGKKKKYAVTVDTMSANKAQFSTKRADWDLARAMHRALKYMERSIGKKLRTDDKGIGASRPRTRLKK
ncbi:hypothetical protein KY335_04165 [Candidatus Woesearchaeota archaeon]|nr:hypothetical protein [Candidatus Woesearchaeota archaeon]MBW3014407.1 hypothetical protein [Candidatus Woesearchaeota archaeon]